MNNSLKKLFFISALLTFSLQVWSVEFSKDEFPHNLFNFGVLVENDTHQIYRSAMLGGLGLYILRGTFKKAGHPFPRTIVYMNKNGYKGIIPFYGNGALREYKKQDKYGFTFHHSFDYENRTYLEGHNPYNPEVDIDADDRLGRKARKIFGVLQDDKVDGGIDALLRIMNIVLDPDKQPVLFHCLGGRHRTGIVALLVRYLQGGEWLTGEHEVTIKYKEHPSDEKKENTFTLNNAQYEYYLHNKEMFRPENIEFAEEFSGDSRFLELKEKYGHYLH
ncbi:MAG: hypothetical protein HOE90_20330 [Bacteriovoracaceae bacterium]|jgi:hypothetical protein|nr:hypothetical protein [Bacteriovoracaceae bacterium]